jgi:surface protein
MGKDRARLLEQNRIDSLNAWGRGLVEAAKNVPVSIIEGGIGTGSGGAYNPEPPPPPPGPDGFTSIWRTTSPGETITLPYEPGGTYSGTIYWGDDTSSENTYATREHIYATPGDYTIIIDGGISGFSFIGASDAIKILNISKWNNINFGNNGYYFNGCSSLDVTAVDAPDFTNTFTLEGMFADCVNLGNSIDTYQWNTAHITNMSYMFSGAVLFNGDITSLNTSSVTDMSSMFNQTFGFDRDLSSWQTNSLINASSMFYSSAAQGLGLENWNISNLQDASYMFSYATNFNGQILNWNTQSVTTMAHMFDSSAFNPGSLTWITSSVTDMSYMFANCQLGGIDLTSFDTIAVTDMSYMFSGGSLVKGNVNGSPDWDVSNVQNMSHMFSGCIPFNEDLNKWDVQAVTNMDSMFNGCVQFNQSIAAWSVNSLTTAVDFMAGKTTADYDYLDNIYIGWADRFSSNGVPTFVQIDFGTIQYTTNAEDGRSKLTSTTPGNASWTITDGGEI